MPESNACPQAGAASPAAKLHRAAGRCIDNACAAAGREYETGVLGTSFAIAFAVCAAVVVPYVVTGVGVWAITNMICGKPGKAKA